MSSREEYPGRYSGEAGASPASGGHLPGSEADDPLFGGLADGYPTTPPPSQTPDEPATQARTDVVPRRTTPAPSGYSQVRRQRPAARRLRRTIRRVDPMSVLRLSLFFYACFLVLWLIFVAFLYWYLEGRGVIEGIREVGESLVLGWDKADLGLFYFERWAFLLGLTFAIVGSLFNAFLAMLYNVAANMFGGLEMTFVEREQ